MKLGVSITFLSVLITIVSCKKDKSEPEKVPEIQTGNVIIGGREYTTVKIGGLIWTSVNYQGNGGIAYDAGNSKPEYGKYYSYSEAQAVALPQGWRIPTEADYRHLTDFAGIIFQNNTVSNPENIKKLTSKTRWKNVAGTNEIGFNVFPGGYSVSNSSPLDGDLGEFWMSDGKTFCIMESGNLTSYRIIFYANSNQPLDRFNLRFVKNAE